MTIDRYIVIVHAAVDFKGIVGDAAAPGTALWKVLTSVRITSGCRKRKKSRKKRRSRRCWHCQPQGTMAVRMGRWKLTCMLPLPVLSLPTMPRCATLADMHAAIAWCRQHATAGEPAVISDTMVCGVFVSCQRKQALQFILCLTTMCCVTLVPSFCSPCCLLLNSARGDQRVLCDCRPLCLRQRCAD